MEIDTQQMEEFLRIQRQQSAQSQTQYQQQSASTTAFTDLLNEALTQQENKSTGMCGLPVTNANQSEMISKILLNPIDTTSVDADTDLLQSAFNSASGTLDLWDSYTKKLGSSDANNLRDVYSILENIDDHVNQLKTNAANLPTQNTELNSLVNELEIMATTERIKFNRGDYA